jgi:hypothetical protein
MLTPNPNPTTRRVSAPGGVSGLSKLLPKRFSAKPDFFTSKLKKKTGLEGKNLSFLIGIL